jgi:O-succinylhomoserine sulfhydrylase
MNEEEFGFETSHPTQLERTQYLEHSVPLYLTLVLYLKMLKTCVRHLLKRKIEIFIAATATRTLMSLWKKYVRWKGQLLVLPFSGMAAVYSTMAALLKFDHIVSSSSVFGATHSLFINYFPKWNIQTSYFDINKPETIESFITPNTKIFLLNRQRILQ